MSRSYFEVRIVDEAARVYRRVASFEKYTDACAGADYAVRELDADFVVWHSDLERFVYDSRKLAS